MDALERYKIVSEKREAQAPRMIDGTRYIVYYPSSIHYTIVDKMNSDNVVAVYSDDSSHAVLMIEIFLRKKILDQEFLDYHVSLLEFITNS